MRGVGGGEFFFHTTPFMKNCPSLQSLACLHLPIKCKKKKKEEKKKKQPVLQAITIFNWFS